MQTSSPLARYEQALSQGEFRPDDVQREAITRLDAIQQGLIARQQPRENSGRGLLGRLSRLVGKEKAAPEAPIRGLYMWGGVGREKPGSWTCFSVNSWRSQTAAALSSFYAAGT